MSVFQEEFINVQMLHVTRMLSVELIVVNVDASALKDSQAMDLYAHQVKTYIYSVLNIDIISVRSNTMLVQRCQHLRFRRNLDDLFVPITIVRSSHDFLRFSKILRE